MQQKLQVKKRWKHRDLEELHDYLNLNPTIFLSNHKSHRSKWTVNRKFTDILTGIIVPGLSSVSRARSTVKAACVLSLSPFPLDRSAFWRSVRLCSGIFNIPCQWRKINVSAHEIWGKLPMVLRYHLIVNRLWRDF